MLEKGKLTVRQFSILVVLFTIGTSILLAPSLLFTHAKQDAWLAAIFGLLAGLLVVWMYGTLGKRFPDLTLMEYSDQLLGKRVGKAVSFLTFMGIFILCALILRNIGDFVTTQILEDTPMLAIHIMFMIIVIIGTRLGLPVIARSAEIFFPWVILLLLAMIFALIPNIKINNVRPVLEWGLIQDLRASLPFIAFPFLELFIFLMLIPSLNQPDKARNGYITGTLIGGGILVLITALTVLVLGGGFLGISIYPTIALARKIKVGEFLTRIEVILGGAWFLSIFFKLTICFYCAALAFAHTFNLKHYKPLTYPLAVLLVPLSIVISPNITYQLTVILTSITIPYFIMGLGYPLLLLAVSGFKKKP